MLILKRFVGKKIVKEKEYNIINKKRNLILHSHCCIDIYYQSIIIINRFS